MEKVQDSRGYLLDFTAETSPGAARRDSERLLAIWLDYTHLLNGCDPNSSGRGVRVTMAYKISTILPKPA